MKCQYCNQTVAETITYQGFEGCPDCVDEEVAIDTEIAYEEALEEMYAGWEAEEEYLRMLKEEELLILEEEALAEAENGQPPW